MGAALVMGLLQRFVESGRSAKNDATAPGSHRGNDILASLSARH